MLGMDDPLIHNDDLRRLADSLQGTGGAMRTWLGAIKAAGDHGEDDEALMRHLERAARYVEQAVKALSTADAVGGEEQESQPTEPGIVGSTRTVPIQNLLSFLSEINAGGVLRIYGSDETFVLQFNGGAVVYAHGDNPPEGMMLGEVLVTMQALHRADLIRVMEQSSKPGATLGGLLVQEGCITQDQLGEALSYQMRHLCHRLFSVEEAHFRFQEGERVIDREDVRMNVTGLLLESARLKDESDNETGNWLAVPFSLE